MVSEKVNINREILGKKSSFQQSFKPFHASLMKYQYRLLIYQHLFENIDIAENIDKGVWQNIDTTNKIYRYR